MFPIEWTITRSYEDQLLSDSSKKSTKKTSQHDSPLNCALLKVARDSNYDGQVGEAALWFESAPKPELQVI
jgi:hypothetical protein